MTQFWVQGQGRRVKISIAGLVVFVIFLVAGCGGGSSGDSLGADQRLSPPSAPEPLAIAEGGPTLTVNTLLFEGRVRSLPPDVALERLTVDTGIIGGVVPVGAGGRFTARMNDSATALLRVVDTKGEIILLQVFPKDEVLARENPEITALSTAVALVALQPGFLTADPILDTLTLAVLEQIPETHELAEQISTELAEGLFAFNKPFSLEVETAIGRVLYRLSTFQTDDVVIAGNEVRFLSQLAHLASTFVKPVNANSGTGLDCIDFFADDFSGHTGTRDDVCIGVEITNPGDPSRFDIANTRTRWVFMTVTGSASSGPDYFKLVPARHIDIPGVKDIFVGFSKLGWDAVLDTKDIIVGALRFNFRREFKSDSRVSERLTNSLDKRFGPYRANAEYVFDKRGDYLLSTLGASRAGLLTPGDQSKYVAASLFLTTFTEVALPVISVLMDIRVQDPGAMTGNSDFCVAESVGLFADQFPRLIILKDELESATSNSEVGKILADYFVVDVLLERRAWTFFGCLLDDLALQLSAVMISSYLEQVVANLGGPLALVQKLSNATEAVANFGAFALMITDSELASEDYYRIGVGEATSSANFGVGDRIQVSSDSDQVLIVVDAPGGEFQGLQFPGVKGTVVGLRTYADGVWWWHVEFDDGVVGWVPEGLLEHYQPVALDVSAISDTGCLEFGICALVVETSGGGDLSLLQFSIDWGDGSPTMTRSLASCLAAGECLDLGENRYRIWKLYTTPSEYAVTFYYSLDATLWETEEVGVNVSETRALALGATPGDGSATLTSLDLGADRHNLCQANEPVGVFDNCAVYSGGALALNIGGPPWLVSGLTNENTYHFRLEAVFGSEQLISEGASATPQAVMPPAGGRWEQMPSFPGISYDRSFTIEHRGYVIGQPTENPLRPFGLWEYDFQRHQWSQRADFPTWIGQGRSLSFVVNGKAYVVTGNQVWEYDPGLDRWTRKSDIPGADKRAGFAFSGRGKGFVGGGFYNLQAFWQYDPMIDSWIQLSDHPILGYGYNDEPADISVISFELGGKVYVTGTNTYFWEYDPAQDTWVAKTFVRAVYAAAAATERAGYVFNALGELYSYDVSRDVWSLETPFPGQRMCYHFGFSDGDNVYFGPGSGMDDNLCGGSGFVNEFWRFVPGDGEVVDASAGFMGPLCLARLQEATSAWRELYPLSPLIQFTVSATSTCSTSTCAYATTDQFNSLGIPARVNTFSLADPSLYPNYSGDHNLPGCVRHRSDVFESIGFPDRGVFEAACVAAFLGEPYKVGSYCTGDGFPIPAVLQ